MSPWPTAQRVPLGARGRQLLLWLLLELWALNLADLLLTRHVIGLGFASESNGVMSFFLRQGNVPAAAFKIGVVTVGTLLLWRLRKHRAALAAGVLLTGVFAAVVCYQVLWALSL